MKSTLFLICTLSAVSVAMAQQPAAPQPPAAGAAAAAATNAAKPWVELRDIQAKLHPMEESLVDTDPEIKALLQKRKEAQQLLQDLDKKRRDTIEARLLANPAAAALIKRRTELLAKIQEMRSAGEAVQPGPNAELSNRLGVPVTRAPAKAP